MIPGDGLASGEFMELEDFDEQIAKCDKIEEYFGPNDADNEYERRISEVEFADGKKSFAWVYWYARNDLNSIKNPVVRVSSGNWREFLECEMTGVHCDTKFVK